MFRCASRQPNNSLCTIRGSMYELVKAYIEEAETKQKEQIENFKTKIGLK